MIKGKGSLIFPENNGDIRIKFDGVWRETI